MTSRIVWLMLILWPLTAPAGEPVTLQLRWDHQFQFAGYYAAKWRGYYDEAGFDVEIRSAITPDGDILKAVDEVAEGRADFGVGAADILIARDRGVPLVVLASIFQESASAFFALESTRLDNLQDLSRLRVARNVNDLVDIEFQAMLLAEGINPEAIDSYPHIPTYAHLLHGLVDVVPGYRITAPYVFEQKRVRYKTLLPSSYGIDFYGDSLFTHRRRVDQDPEAVERFIRATKQGWRYALAHPVETADRISSRLSRAIERPDLGEFNRFQIAGVKALTLYPIAEIGHINPHRWRRMSELMQAIGILTSPIDVDELIFDPVRLKQKRTHQFYKSLKIALYAVSALALLGCIWTFVLRRAVNQKTRDLKRSEEKYRDLIERMEEGIWILDQNASTTFVNPAMARMLGYGEAEMLGKSLFSFVDNDSVEIATHNFNQRRRGVGEQHEFEFLGKDGRKIHTIIDTKPILDDGGNFLGAFGVIRDITDWKRAEAERAKSEARLKNLVANSPIVIYTCKPDDDFGATFISDNLRRLLGYTPQEIVEDSGFWMDHVHPDDLDRVRAELNRLFETGHHIHEYRFRHEDGGYRWMHDELRLVRDADGNPLEIVGSWIDITERKQAEALSRKNLTILKEASRIANLGGWEWDLASNTFHLSEPWLKIHGCDEESVSGDRLLSIAHPDDVAAVHAAFDNALKMDAPYDLTHRIIRQTDGEIRFIKASGEIVTDDQGNPVRMYGAAKDITNQKMAGDALRKARRDLKVVFDLVPVMIWQKDLDGRYLQVNRMYCETVGRSENEILGKMDNELFPKEIADKYAIGDHKALNGGTSVTASEERHLKSSGEYGWSYTKKVAYHDIHEKVAGTIGFALDITDRKRAEEKIQEYSVRLEEMVQERTQQLKQAQEELLLKERLAVLGHFAGSISHEIRNPLAVIDTAAYFVKLKLAGRDEKLDQHLGRIQGNVKKATDIIESLLNLTRMEKPKTKPCALADFVEKTLRSCKIPESVDVVRKMPADDVRLEVDAEQVRMALKNLIQNAVQAMDGGGTLTLAGRVINGDQLELVVSDTGPGIPADQLEKVFEPLFTTRAQGIGFGLSITRMIIENHGGRISARSGPGPGAAFTLTLPIDGFKEA